jgi:hypothetical protein
MRNAKLGQEIYCRQNWKNMRIRGIRDIQRLLLHVARFVLTNCKYDYRMAFTRMIAARIVQSMLEKDHFTVKIIVSALDKLH